MASGLISTLISSISDLLGKVWSEGRNSKERKIAKLSESLNKLVNFPKIQLGVSWANVLNPAKELVFTEYDLIWANLDEDLRKTLEQHKDSCNKNATPLLHYALAQHERGVATDKDWKNVYDCLYLFSEQLIEIIQLQLVRLNN